MSTFATIQDRVLRRLQPYLIEDDASLVEIPGAINRAIRIAQEHQLFRSTVVLASFTTTLATRALGNKPADWRQRRANPYLLTDTDDAQIEIQWLPDEQEDIRLFSQSTSLDKGQPLFIQERVTDFAVFPFPDGESDYSGGEYRVKIPYHKWFTDLSAASDSNWLTDNAEDMIVWAAAGDILFDIPGQEQRAVAWMFGPEPKRAPISRADRELRRVISQEKSSSLPRHFVLRARRDPLGPLTQPHLGY